MWLNSRPGGLDLARPDVGTHVTTSAEAAHMKVLSSAPDPEPGRAAPYAGLAVVTEPGPPWLAATPHNGPPARAQEEPFGRVARLAALVLGTQLACVAIAGERSFPGRRRPGAGYADQRQSVAEASWCQRVIDTAAMLIVDDARHDPRTSASCPIEPGSVIAWAGLPILDAAGHVVGALCVADDLPRHWSATEIEVLATLAFVASREVALQVALQHGAERAELAQTLQESLLPPRLPQIPGLQVAARYVAGGTGAEVLGDFYDVFPSMRGSWGIVVGDVCGKGAPAAKSTALARYTLRAEAHRQTRPSLVLAALNQALLDWITDDPRFLTAIYATVRPTLGGASVQLSSAGHPLALVRRRDGFVQTFGRPGTLLGLLPDPELHDSHRLLRAGDCLILFTDGVTEARSQIDRALYGDERLRDFIAGLEEDGADQIADAIQHAVLAFSGADISDDTVTLVLKVPRYESRRRQLQQLLAMEPRAGVQESR
jgi:phosphoserine phosphatase RsbU/P